MKDVLASPYVVEPYGTKKPPIDSTPHQSVIFGARHLPIAQTRHTSGYVTETFSHLQDALRRETDPGIVGFLVRGGGSAFNFGIEITENCGGSAVIPQGKGNRWRESQRDHIMCGVMKISECIYSLDKIMPSNGDKYPGMVQVSLRLKDIGLATHKVALSFVSPVLAIAKENQSAGKYGLENSDYIRENSAWFLPQLFGRFGLRFGLGS